MRRAESDAFMNRIEQRFDDQGYGLWCVDLRWRVDRVHRLHEARGSATASRSVGGSGPSTGATGYAPEAARACLALGFAPVEDGGLGLDEVISFTARTNAKSRRVMDKIGLRYDRDADFDHPGVPEGNPLRPHVLYRISAVEWSAFTS